MHELDELESHAANLIRTYQHLKDENNSLKKQCEALLNEQSKLQKKQEEAAAKVKQLINQLRVLEPTS